MEADWSEAARLGPSSTGPATPATAFAFDTAQELLWIGDENGRVTSYYGLELQKYTSYRGHVSTAPRGAPGNVPVKQFLFCDRGVISIAPRSVHLSSRKGLVQWHLALDDMLDLRCMSFTTREHDEIVAAGCQSCLYRINVDSGKVTETLTPPAMVPYTLMRRSSQYICAAAHDGSIHLLHPKTLSTVRSWTAYTGTVNDMDARGDYLLTCGWAQQQHGSLGLERLVRVYDLKGQKPAAPVAFQSGAAFVRMHPKLSSTCIVLSQTGVIQSIEVQNPDLPLIRYAHMYEAQVIGLELMPSGKGFALTDSHCSTILWGSPSQMQFTEFAKPTELADGPSPDRQLDWSPAYPLSLIGMPYYREALLSGWPNSLVHEVGAPPPKLDLSLVRPRPGEPGLVGPHVRKTRRYEVTDTRSPQKAQDALAAPRFKSEKPRDEDGEHEPERRMSEDAGKVLSGLTLDGTAQSDPLFYYRPPEIKYSKFGIEDFDFSYFNKTKHSGLETHIVNSYANPLLQLYRFTNVARDLALRHAAQDCRYDNCMLCELGFLVDMLEKAKGQNCQATNFLKALSKQPGAQTLGILEEQTINTPLSAMIQTLNRVLLQRFEDNYKRVAGNTGGMQRAFGMTGSACSKCTHCQYEDVRHGAWYIHDLIYPSRAIKASPRSVRHSFSRLLKDSIERFDHTRGWCMRCQSYKTISSRRRIYTIPSVLMVNTAIHAADAKQMWSTPGFLPSEIGVIVQDGQLHCYEGQDLQFHLQRGVFLVTVYKLVGTVVDVAPGQGQKSHLVSIVDAAISEPLQSDSTWYLLNDFLVRPVAGEEATRFDMRWKLPAIVTYQIKNMAFTNNDSWKSDIDTSVLFRSVSQPTSLSTYLFQPLTPSEPLPNESTHCAIDAEFVRLLQEEVDIAADGSRTITRPARSGLARVSVLRGDGAHAQLPFIDDYIAIDEPIDDYLTQYSGLQPGDLTPGISRFSLVSLKEVYKKLWVLLNLGCRFVGHGLSSDFRIVNIHIPDAQVIDTLDLFSLSRFKSQRKLSLRFLAWAVLQEDIQHHATQGHDSIEDARTALKLWRKYLEAREAGTFDDLMETLWHKGRRTDFKVPVEAQLAPREGRRVPETPSGSAPGTPVRRPVSVGKVEGSATPSRGEVGSPLRVDRSE